MTLLLSEESTAKLVLSQESLLTGSVRAPECCFWCKGGSRTTTCLWRWRRGMIAVWIQFRLQCILRRQCAPKNVFFSSISDDLRKAVIFPTSQLVFQQQGGSWEAYLWGDSATINFIGSTFIHRGMHVNITTVRCCDSNVTG